LIEGILLVRGIPAGGSHHCVGSRERRAHHDYGRPLVLPKTATSVAAVLGSCETRGWEERRRRHLERIEGKWVAQRRICDRNPRKPVAFAA